MKRLISGVLLLLCSFPAAAQTEQDSIALATAEWRQTALTDDAVCRCAQIDLFGSRQCISVVRFPSRSYATRIVQLNREGRTTSSLGRTAGAAAAINGSYFNMKTFEAETFVLLDGRILARTMPVELMRTNGVVAVRDRRGRRVEILACDTTDYPRIARRYRSALAAGPMLVEKGRIATYDSEDGFYTRRHPRSLIGRTRRGEVVMVVIDGRAKGQGDGTTIAETAFIACQLGLEDALNLDGGGSSTLWTAQEGVLNHPSDNRRFDHEGERAVPNCIAVLKND